MQYIKGISNPNVKVCSSLIAAYRIKSHSPLAVSLPLPLNYIRQYAVMRWLTNERDDRIIKRNAECVVCITSAAAFFFSFFISLCAPLPHLPFVVFELFSPLNGGWNLSHIAEYVSFEPFDTFYMNRCMLWPSP